MSTEFLPEYITKILNRLTSAGYTAYVVGGCVRDFIMNVAPHDYDITTSALPTETLSVFSDLNTITIGLKHGTVAVVCGNEVVEITTFRIDGNYSDGRHPDSVSFSTDLTCDLSRRDFTANAIAYSPKSGYIDPFCGRDDIEKHIIRTVGDPDTRFLEDGLRILRALRFSATLNFDIEHSTAISIQKNAHLLKRIAVERILDELKKLFCTQYSERLSQIITEFFPVFSVIMPDLHAGCATISALAASEPDFHVRMALLFSGCDMKLLENTLMLYRTDKKLMRTTLDMSFALKYVCNNEKMLTLLLGILSYDDMHKVCNAKSLIDSTFCADSAHETLNMLKTRHACTSVAELDCSGNDLLALGFHGQLVGKVLNALFLQVLIGNCANTRDALLELASSLIA